jgi:hypothetical protein
MPRQTTVEKQLINAVFTASTFSAVEEPDAMKEKEVKGKKKKK